MPPWFRKAVVDKICGEADFDVEIKEKVVCHRGRARMFEQAIQTPDDPSVEYPGKLVIWEDESPADAVELWATDGCFTVSSR